VTLKSKSTRLEFRGAWPFTSTDTDGRRRQRNPKIVVQASGATKIAVQASGARSQHAGENRGRASPAHPEKRAFGEQRMRDASW